MYCIKKVKKPVPDYDRFLGAGHKPKAQLGMPVQCHLHTQILK